MNLLSYAIGQVFGVVSGIGCLVMPLWKQKWQMLIFSAISNFAAVLNLVFIGEAGSAAIINLLATLQVLVSLWHVLKEKPVTKAENIIFFFAYTVLGCIGIKKAIDVLPIIGVLLFMFAAFQRDEQKTRLLTLINSVVFMGYYIIIGSTVVLAEIFAIVSSSVGLIRYRR